MITLKKTKSNNHIEIKKVNTKTKIYFMTVAETIFDIAHSFLQRIILLKTISSLLNH